MLDDEWLLPIVEAYGGDQTGYYTNSGFTVDYESIATTLEGTVSVQLPLELSERDAFRVQVKEAVVGLLNAHRGEVVGMVEQESSWSAAFEVLALGGERVVGSRGTVEVAEEDRPGEDGSGLRIRVRETVSGSDSPHGAL